MYIFVIEIVYICKILTDNKQSFHSFIQVPTCSDRSAPIPAEVPTSSDMSAPTPAHVPTSSDRSAPIPAVVTTTASSDRSAPTPAQIKKAFENGKLYLYIYL